jgi:hypothetical protein
MNPEPTLDLRPGICPSLVFGNMLCGEWSGFVPPYPPSVDDLEAGLNSYMSRASPPPSPLLPSKGWTPPSPLTPPTEEKTDVPSEGEEDQEQKEDRPPASQRERRGNKDARRFHAYLDDSRPLPDQVIRLIRRASESKPDSEVVEKTFADLSLSSGSDIKCLIDGCPRLFRCKTTYVEHLLVIHVQYNHLRCSRCPRLFPSQKTRRRHEREHGVFRRPKKEDRPVRRRESVKN